MSRAAPLILSFDSIDSSHLPLVGGKGANLGEMTQAGFPIPAGFCVTTDAFQQFISACPESDAFYAMLEALQSDDVASVRQVGKKVRAALIAVHIPKAIRDAVLAAWQESGIEQSYAVRSSATAEDLPDASFAGQQDSFLNVRGAEALLDSVRRCWVSLFTDRAILYRIKNGFNHRDVSLSVVVQRMVLPDVSGILFTADPVSGRRHIASIDASYGLGEALVAGLVNADLYRVDKRSGELVESKIGDKELAIRPLPDGGTFQERIYGVNRKRAALTEPQAIQLAEIGTRIERHYGRPQDIEWCIQNGQIFIVQSRPITTLYPIPHPTPDDAVLRVYFSFGHAQVMTDPISPMGISLWRILFPFGKVNQPLAQNPYMLPAGGRIFIDMTPLLHRPVPRHIVLTFLTAAEQLSATLLWRVSGRDEFKTRRPSRPVTGWQMARWMLPLIGRGMLNLWWRPPEKTTDRLNARSAQIVAESRALLEAAPPGAARLHRAQELLGTIFLGEAIHFVPFVMSGIIAQQLLLRLAKRVGLKRDAEATMRGLSGNVTTEMDLAVGDLADAARQAPQLVARLQSGEMEAALHIAATDNAARPFWQAWRRFLDAYGMRGPSEIDIARPRYRDEPSSVLRMVAGSLGHTRPGAHRAHHEAMKTQGEAAGERLAAALSRGPLGWFRTRLVRRLIRVGRNQATVREHPKFFLIQHFGLVRSALLEAGQILRDQNRLESVDDIWMLTLPELIAILEDETAAPRDLVAARQLEMAHFGKLTPPRIILSDGETPTAIHNRLNIPEGALAGSAVSAGIVEGVAHVVLDPTKETLNPGEILVAPFTDPGWTPLFINAAGLVMEVGGLMTHGSVVAREYGIPAVVSVPEATRHIQSGQIIRVNGDGGFVELLN